jgi:hypothetical protein
LRAFTGSFSIDNVHIYLRKSVQSVWRCAPPIYICATFYQTKLFLNKTMKKVLTLLSVCAVLFLAACNNAEHTDADHNDTTTVNNTTVTAPETNNTTVTAPADTTTVTTTPDAGATVTTPAGGATVNPH